MKLLLVLALCASTAAAAVPYRQSGFKSGDGWEVWSPRREIRPRAWIAASPSRGEPGTLALSGDSNEAVFGGWERLVDGVNPGQWYRFTAWYRAEQLDYEPRQVLARLDWVNASGRRAGQPDYAAWRRAENGWNEIALDAQAPENAAGVKLQLFVVNAPRATVWWDDVALESASAPVRRDVTIAALNVRPMRSSDPVGDMIRALESVPSGADIIVLPEAITLVGTGKQYADVAEPAPGPTTRRLGEVARTRHAWIAAGIIERDGPVLYNTAVLIDREGELRGRYRKVYLPREEIEGGLTAGSGYPVFRTDFGTVGLMICWDVQYPDPARALALRGAELVLMPIWGGNVKLGAARAIENQLFLASAGYDYPTEIVDPEGDVLALSKERGRAAVATVDLNRRYRDPWLGDMRARMLKEARLDTLVDPPGRK